MRTYYFKIGNQAAQAFDVKVDGLCTGDGINNYTLNKMAEHHAKLLANLFDVQIKYWPQDKPENVVCIDFEPAYLMHAVS